MTIELLTLPDDRVLELSVLGPERGLPLVYHHGTPGGATPPRFLEREVTGRGLRLVSFSRPGYGDSSRLAGRKVVDVVEDTAAVLAHLGAERSLVAGWSGGGPHALACAARLATARAALVIAGVAPYEAEGLDFLAGMGEDNVDEFGAAVRGEEGLAAYLGTQRPGLQGVTPAGVVDEMGSLLPEVDRAVLTDEFGEDLAGQFHDGLRVSADGWLDDDLAFVRPWGFALEEVAVPVLLWQGEEDLMVPFAHGRWLADRVPGVAAHLEAGEGHLSIGIGAADRMLDELVAAV